jgi:hypothetical protein
LNALEDGADERTPGALSQVMPKLKSLSDGEILRPRQRIGSILADIGDLAKVVQRPAVRQRVLAVGVKDEQLEELKLALDALREAESLRLRVRSSARRRSSLELAARSAPRRAGTHH